MDILARINYKLDRWNKALYIKDNLSNLTNKDFTIFSNNCWGGIVYQDLKLPYLSPTVNMYMFIPCYLKFLGNLDYYLGLELKFTKISKYDQANVSLNRKSYPLGKLDDIEIHFIHYEDAKLTSEAWYKRVSRMNLDNVFVAMSERDLCETKHIEEFDQLEFKNKICFTVKDYPFASTLKIDKYSSNQEVAAPDMISSITYRKLDLVNWLNNGAKK